MAEVLYPLARPRVGASGRTGVWRSMRPVVDYARCTGCLSCWLYCPDASIEVVEGRVRVDLDYCKGCGICAEVCPFKAISMVEEGEG